jgi:hypothetical protein
MTYSLILMVIFGIVQLFYLGVISVNQGSDHQTTVSRCRSEEYDFLENRCQIQSSHSHTHGKKGRSDRSRQENSKVRETEISSPVSRRTQVVKVVICDYPQLSNIYLIILLRFIPYTNRLVCLYRVYVKRFRNIHL